MGCKALMAIKAERSDDYVHDAGELPAKSVRGHVHEVRKEGPITSPEPGGKEPLLGV